METNIGQECQDTSSTFATIIGRFINRRYFQILRTINWINIQPDYTFATIANQQNYVLPDDFGKEISCADMTNGLTLRRMDLGELYKDYSDDVDDAGEVSRYVIYTDVVKAQPTSASVLTITSSSTADTTQTIMVRGISSGVETYETLTLTGSPATRNTTNQYTRIKGISKSVVTTGYLTVTSNSGAVTLALIPPEVLETRYKLIKLHYVPASAISIGLPYIISPLPLSQNYDYPVIDCADLIELGSLADVWKYKRQFSKSQSLEIMFNQQLQDLIFDQVNQPNQVHQFLPSVYDNDSLY